MKHKATVQFNFDSFNLIDLLLKYWKILLVTGLASVIISSVASLKMTPLFRSAVVLYPTTNVVESQSLLGIQSTTTALFGDESATEKILQILKSDDIKNFLVSKYDLMSHYKINENAKYKYTLLDSRMNKYISSRKTQYNSVEINVLDADPDLAATMANDIARQIDTVFNRIVKNSGQKSYNALNNSYKEQYIRVKSLEDSLSQMGSGLRSGYSVRFKAGSSNSSWITASEQYSPDFLRLMNMFESENENLSTIRGRLTEAKMLAEQNLPYIHIINEAKVAERKALPKRSMIVFASTFSTLLVDYVHPCPV